MHGIGQQLCTRVTSSSCSHKFDAADTTGIQEKNVYSEMQNSRCGRESRMGYWAWGGGGGVAGNHNAGRLGAVRFCVHNNTDTVGPLGPTAVLLYLLGPTLILWVL